MKRSILIILAAAAIFCSTGVRAETGTKASASDPADASIKAGPSAVALGDSLLVEAEGFSSHGGWSLDQQFMQTMGSPYLLAHGLGKPVADAVTRVIFKSTGKYRMWVRTMDWVPGKWKSPGRFQVILDGVTVDKEFGTLAGWKWQDGGMVDIKKKSLQIKLHDLTGFEGRCDAIFFSKDSAEKPVDFDSAKPSVNRKWRNKLRGLDDTPPDGGKFDVIVVGGGIAGCAAALAAEERGMRVALINDRKALGGNASIDVRVSTGGEYGNGKRILAQLRGSGGKVEAQTKLDQARRDQAVAAADGIKLFVPYRAYGVEMADGRIVSVAAVSTVTGKALRLRSGLFIDCTGDGWIGYWAGAEHRYGRESYTEFGEKWDKKILYPRKGHLTSDPLELWSPKKPDNHVMGTSLIWNSRNAKNNVSFPEVPWAMDISDYSVAVEGGWKWEYSANDKHQVDDAEYIRDHLLRAIYSSFSRAKQKKEHAKRELNWVGYISGKRESRRLMGDYIYTMKDMVNGTHFDDAVVREKRMVDVHFQKCREGLPDDFRSWALYRKVPHSYSVPFRCLYSKNVDNLMMAGRCYSCSHIGLGGPRVMLTCGQMGIATGYAASLCVQHQTTPRGVYKKHIGELQKLIGHEPGPQSRTDVKIGVGGKSRRASDDEKKFDISEMPAELKGLSTVTISRGSSRKPTSGYKFMVSKDSDVYLVVHDRGGYKPPKEWKKTDLKLKWATSETDTVYKRLCKKGEVIVPRHGGKRGSSYGIPHMAFVKDGKVGECD